MTKIYRFVQGSEEWLQHRLLFRNASETAAVMGISPWQSPYQLWEVKTGRRSQEVTFPMQRGMDLEPKAREAYEQATGYVMEPIVMVDGDYSCSLDGMSFDGDLILEVKCPFHGRDSETWKMAEKGQVEAKYMAQVQHQIMVTRASQCDFYVFDGKEGIVVPVMPDSELQGRIRRAWDVFWEFIVSDTPPPLTSLDTVLRDDPEWRRAAEEFITRKAAAEEAAKAVEAAKSRLASLARHTSERGFGVAVCRFWRGPKASKEEVRVTVLKQEEEQCRQA